MEGTEWRKVCTLCHLAVNMARSGGVTDGKGRPYHASCLSVQRAAENGDVEARRIMESFS